VPTFCSAFACTLSLVLVLMGFYGYDATLISAK